MITKERLSDNALLGNISTNSSFGQHTNLDGESNENDATVNSTNHPSQEYKRSDESNGKHQSTEQKTESSSHRIRITGLLATEDSCNAVDNKIVAEDNVEEDAGGSSVDSDLSFNGKINNLKNDHGRAPNNTVFTLNAGVGQGTGCERIDTTKSIDTESIAESKEAGTEHNQQQKKQLNASAEILAKENSSWMHYNNEKSPDLFADDDTVDAVQNYDTDGKIDRADECEELKSDTLRRSKSWNRSGLGPADLEFLDDADRNDHVERILLKRLQGSLSGVPPPPSLTFSHIEVDHMLTLYHENSLQYFTAAANENPLNSREHQCLSKPTHTTDQLPSIGWPELLQYRAHGVHYNKSTVTEKLELLGLKYVERYIGAETSSSFNVTKSPTSAKKRNQRMKMLNKSPGNRLSHLAKRRAIFSSANLLNSSVCGKANDSIAGNGPLTATSLSRLNSFRLCNRQVLMDPKKSDNRRKNKIKTPKRRTPGLAKPSPRRRTPGSSAKKLTLPAASSSARSSQQLHVPATRESSKRALFLSPQNGSATSSQDQQHLAASRSKQINRSLFSETRLQKSKRSLFSPQKTGVENDSERCSANLKRRRSPEVVDDNENEHGLGERTEKIRRTDGGLAEEDLTPRSLKLARSKSFCVGAQTIRSVTAQTQPGGEPGVSGKPLFRANSATIPDAGNRPAVTLTEVQRQKLFWAVSQALQSKQISVKHELFKEHASRLVRVVKRLFLEFNDPLIRSTSEKLLRLANKHVYEVIQGKSWDDIYFREKTRILNARNMTKLKGYIGPDEYEMHKSQRAVSMASITSLDSASVDRSSQLSASQSWASSQISSVCDLSQVSEASSGTSGLKAPARNVSFSSDCVSETWAGVPTTTALRENIDSELRQRSSAQKQAFAFSGRDQKNLSPFRADKASCGNVHTHNNKLLVGGALTSSILKAKRQISFE
ncbi:uncharacterized protein LOC128267729 [Anopheles cruzii]|uniref:uncharacterized protein LOC128267729 n=1 Tax=Anopheles cruzii TaxID=68878 RepID=UPI0022EC5E5A|nr:uncharacterized protein LOC128267729 [Anopheles cruzii]